MKPLPVHIIGDLRSRYSGPLGGYVLALLVLLASLLLVVLYWHGAQEREMRAAEADFAAETDAIGELLAQRLNTYELVLRGGVSLFASVDRPSAEQWRDYVDALKIGEHYPDMVGLGYTPYLDQAALQAMQIDLRDSGKGYYQLRPAGAREFYGPILYLEPRTPENVAAVGYDMFAEPVRHQAMAAARDTGQIRISTRVQLVQDGAVQTTGLLMYAPVYRQRIPTPTTLKARRESLQGWVYVPLHMDAFVQAALRMSPRNIAMRIVDVDDNARRNLYSSQLPVTDHQQPAPLFTRTRVLDHYGRRWEITFSADRRASMAERTSELRRTLSVGLLASLLLFAIALALARTEALAEMKAERLYESFQRSELRFRNAMRFSAIGKALLDHKGAIVDANPALASMLGTTTDALVGQDFEGLLLADGDEAVLRRKQMAFNDGVFRSTRQIRLAGGQIRHLQLTFALMPGETGDDVANLVQVEDITDHVFAQARERELNRALEARVESRTRELTHANQELESFAYSISHDLRAPLRTIEGFSRLLGERYATKIDAEGQDYLARVRNAAARMDELIGALLKMSRVSRGPLLMESLDISSMANEIAAECRMTQPERQVDIMVEPGMQAVGDAALIRNLLENLIGNAWKFTAGTRDACIGIGTDPGTAAFAAFHVRDNGAGFANDYAGKLFRPFQRLHRQEEYEGNGIGLASVKRIVERHGGSVSAEAEEGRGATFRFTLPRDLPAS